MTKHFGDKMDKWYREYCPQCHGHNTGEMVRDEMRKVILYKCKACGFTYGYENIKDLNPKYHSLNRSQIKREKK